MNLGPFLNSTLGGKRVPNPVRWSASQRGTLRNEVSPMHRPLRKEKRATRA